MTRLIKQLQAVEYEYFVILRSSHSYSLNDFAVFAQMNVRDRIMWQGPLICDITNFYNEMHDMSAHIWLLIYWCILIYLMRLRK